MKLRSASLLAVATALSLSACVPDLGTRPEPRSATTLAAKASLPNEGGQWPGDGWWERYGDAQLDRLMQEGLAGSPDLTAAAARLVHAEGVARSAGAALVPNVNATGSATLIKQLGQDNLPDTFQLKGWPRVEAASLKGNFDLDFWGRNHARLRAALHDVDAARVEQAQARVTLSTAIAQAYADLARLYAERTVAEETLRIVQDTSGLVSDRVRNGLDTEGQYRQAAAQVPSARADIAQIDENIAITRNQLAALIGAGPDRGLTIDPPALARLTTTALPASAGIDLVGRRPDIVAARARVEAAAERIKVAKAAFYPDISLSAMIGFQNLNIASLATGSLLYATAGPALSLPVFDGGQRSGDYRVARADYDAAVADYDSTLIQALRQVADAIASRNSLAAQIREVRASLDDAQKAYDIARLRYKGQLSTYLDALSAEQGVIAARRRDADLSARAFTLDVALVRALGGGYSEPRQTATANAAATGN
ncbi:efflux transporter outer membrane subunit [Sphingomonas nostoxanthinifaciens]|uniref:efflux transporter outer membrane subunit n=1 Tax=Sphingomonas nostoxanthinifaciens TaxID=2872652 RepID=UPI001CC1F0E2|nr:efflux transporter outer membrane subunit [Sphingomonas nostoxanthinifaciens]UAK24297.1 efflux transporter outer membrane subunit [Sphingomonas nostoxanthinifaciens]